MIYKTETLKVEIRPPLVTEIDALATLFDDFRAFYGYIADLDGARDFVEARMREGETHFFVAVIDGRSSASAI